jgi:hypothetical protein
VRNEKSAKIKSKIARNKIDAKIKDRIVPNEKAAVKTSLKTKERKARRNDAKAILRQNQKKYEN